MKTRTLLLLVFALPLLALAQTEKKQFIHKGLFSTYLTLTPASMLAFHTSNIYLHGNSEYYFDNKISVRGDGFYFINSVNNLSPVDYSHNLFFGPSYHFRTKNSIDPYLSVQPGVSYTLDNLIFGNNYDPLARAFTNTNEPSFNTLLSGTFGFNYYATRFFHLFMEARYVQGKHRTSDIPISLNELRFSFGLAFNLNTVKPNE